MRKIDELLVQEMNRRQFLILMGSALISLLGFSAVMGMFTKTTPVKQEVSNGGFGGGGFGK
jgi:hypothetical protein